VQFVDRIQRYLTLLEWQPGEAVSQSATITHAPAAHGAPAPETSSHATPGA
jgi:hypothetical protein